jgi:hypothetical protein
LERARQERAARLERILAHLRDPLWQDIGAIAAIVALAQHPFRVVSPTYTNPGTNANQHSDHAAAHPFADSHRDNVSFAIG